MSEKNKWALPSGATEQRAPDGSVHLCFFSFDRVDDFT